MGIILLLSIVSALSVDSSESALGAEFFLTKSGWYDIMDLQTEIRRMISALHNLDRKNAKKIEKATKTIIENKL